jgi:hypothetical protein
MYARRMPRISAKPKRKVMFLSSTAQRNLAKTSSRRRTERQAVEEALELLAAKDARSDAMQEFIDWATEAWGAPSAADKKRAEKIWDNR